MDYLLDTHALLWALTEPKRLGRRARSIIATSRHRIHVSSATMWEVSTKHRLGRLPQADVLVRRLVHHVDRLGAADLPMTAEHALLAGSLDWAHRDPFDRMLAAQAMVGSMTLVTKDEAFAGLPGLRTVW